MALPGVQSQNKSDARLVMWRGFLAASRLYCLLLLTFDLWMLTRFHTEGAVISNPPHWHQTDDFFLWFDRKSPQRCLTGMAAAGVGRVQSWGQPPRWSCGASTCCPPLRAGQWRQHLLKGRCSDEADLFFFFFYSIWLQPFELLKHTQYAHIRWRHNHWQRSLWSH